MNSRTGRRVPALCAMIALASLCGCARSSITTDVKPSGAFTRTLVFRGQAREEGAAPNPLSGMALRDVFELPSGQGWTTKTTKEKDESVYTASRSSGRGETILKDVVVKSSAKGGPAKALVSNEISVRQIAPGRLEYREVIHWLGKRPELMKRVAPELLQVVKSALPAGIATDAEAKATGLVIQRELWRMLFGPNDPLLAQLITFPDLLERRLKRRVGMAVNSALQARYGQRMSVQARQEATRKVVASMDSALKGKQNELKEKAGGESGDDGSLASLTFAVRMPGKIVSTNGEFDDSTGEVYWGLYAQAAALEDVTLIAVCDARKTAGK